MAEALNQRPKFVYSLSFDHICREAIPLDNRENFIGENKFLKTSRTIYLVPTPLEVM